MAVDLPDYWKAVVFRSQQTSPHPLRPVGWIAWLLGWLPAGSPQHPQSERRRSLNRRYSEIAEARLGKRFEQWQRRCLERSGRLKQRLPELLLELIGLLKRRLAKRLLAPIEQRKPRFERLR